MKATIMNHAIQSRIVPSKSKRGQVSNLRGVRYGPVVCLAAWLCLCHPVHPQTPLPDDFNPGANETVHAFAVQADGKILVGGTFTALGGQTRNYIGRLNADGSLDSSFNPGAGDISDYFPSVNSLVVQAEGEILVGGNFTTLGGQTRTNIGRLNADGSLDGSFNPGADGEVYCLAVQADGKILVGGTFTTLGGQTRTNIGRLNADGSLDNSFNPGAVGVPYPNPSVNSLAVQADGKILAGGYFSTLGGQMHNSIGRLNADGSLDSSFNTEADREVNCLAVQADGKILVGGWFTTLGGQPCNSIGRLNADGSLDSSFNPGANGRVVSLAVQADGKILVGGWFTTLGGQTRGCVGRLNADGSLESSFNPGADSDVNSLAVQANGEIVVGGFFSTVGGQTRANIARLNNTGPATQSLGYDGSTITWLRGSSSPEVWRVTFDLSTNSSTWQALGPGSRVPGTGWQLVNVSLPPGGTIRARGYATGGDSDGSGWFVEAYWGSLVVVTQPTSRTNDAQTTAAFAVVAGGTGPLGYQWLKNGAPLANAGSVSGALTPTLTLSNLLKPDAAQYAVVITNALGSLTSRVVTLTVNDPAITAQPASQNTQLGQTATLSVTTAGTQPLTYQWLKDGAVQAQDTTSALTLTNLQGADTGNYSVVVSNVYGTLTSAVAVLTVNLAPLDGSFNAGMVAAFRDLTQVSSLAVQADERVLMAGDFDMLAGQTRSSIGRLNADGSLDSKFNPGAGGLHRVLSCLAVQADGKILVGGPQFPGPGGQVWTNLFRLNADGTLDESFNPAADNGVNSLALLADGKILVGGYFSTLVGQARTSLGLLNADGSLDSTFNPGAVGGLNPYPSVNSLAVQADGKILVGGSFDLLAGQTRTNIGRLNADGSLDSSFNAGADGGVYSLALQADGKIVVGGNFTTLDGQTRTNIGRLNADGSLDSSFNPGAGGVLYPWPYPYASVNSLAVQTDAKILVGGNFDMLGGQMRNSIGRLNADGSLDSTFSPEANGPVNSLAVQADGKILVGGGFYLLGGQMRDYIARLNNTGPATQSLSYNGSTLTWLRGGTSPEVWRTTFDFSTNAVDWVSLGAGTRIGTGWQLTNTSLPSTTGTIRARGFVPGGGNNPWFMESTLLVGVPTSPPVILTSDGYFGFGANGFGFNISAAAGRTIVVEASANLLNWAPVATNLIGSGPFYFSDPGTGALPARFYRARSAP